ncbi:RIP metalloprotease RseP [Neisseria lisongii]|uniref:Zinc metalloprotease n=1 Tax=Neisseria lisongii TaxID=2912188 RepID=A0AAW5ALA2_9NEIS|nr:RIP metalloprotease RseP [Neisseria lisongii]MCF7529939.1 RIP metalloprotease RseP [Neisseria lisongii]
MQTILSFIVAILILVSLHELGHYSVARLCGVKVKRFSVGFGKPFYTKKRGDTEWCLAPVPLGGYVKMLDTREGTVAEADLPYAFDRQHPAKRIAIVAAGPLTNLILAVLLYGTVFSFGITEIRPYVGTVEQGSIAAQAGFQAGDKIRAVNGKSIDDWNTALTEMVLNLEAGAVTVAVETAEGSETVRTIEAAGTEAAGKIAKNNGGIGLWAFKITPKIAFVQENSAAERAGLKAGDTLLAADGKAISDWQQWAELFRNSPGKKLDITYNRGGETFNTALRPDSFEFSDGLLVGRAGLAPEHDQAWDKKVRRHYVPTIGEAFKMGWDKTAEYVVLTVKFIGKLITGNASAAHLSGPLTIADVAGKSASLGILSYLEFLAVVSISLGVLNLLPIPVLDGGHLVYYTAEWIRGKPLSERVQAVGLRIGMAVMLLMMLVAFFNDINRLFG